MKREHKCEHVSVSFSVCEHVSLDVSVSFTRASQKNSRGVEAPAISTHLNLVSFLMASLAKAPEAVALSSPATRETVTTIPVSFTLTVNSPPPLFWSHQIASPILEKFLTAAPSSWGCGYQSRS